MERRRPRRYVSQTIAASLQAEKAPAGRRRSDFCHFASPSNISGTFTFFFFLSNLCRHLPAKIEEALNY